MKRAKAKTLREAGHSAYLSWDSDHKVLNNSRMSLKLLSPLRPTAVGTLALAVPSELGCHPRGSVCLCLKRKLLTSTQRLSYSLGLFLILVRVLPCFRP